MKELRSSPKISILQNKDKFCNGGKRNYSQESLEQFNVITESSLRGSERKLVPILSPQKTDLIKSKNEKRVRYDFESEQPKEIKSNYTSINNDVKIPLHKIGNYYSNQFYTRDTDSIKVIENEMPDEDDCSRTQGS